MLKQSCDTRYVDDEIQMRIVEKQNKLVNGLKAR